MIAGFAAAEAGVDTDWSSGDSIRYEDGCCDNPISAAGRNTISAAHAEQQSSTLQLMAQIRQEIDGNFKKVCEVCKVETHFLWKFPWAHRDG